MTTTTEPRRLGNRLLAPALMLGGVVCVLGVAESVARARRPDLTHGSVRERVENQRYVWSRPDAEFHHVGDGVFALRFPQAAPGDGRRILVVGDSFAMGHGVRREERFAAVAARRLDREEDVDVLATSGYSPIVYRNIVRRALASASYETIAVFVDQTDPADDSLLRNDLVDPSSRVFDVNLMRDRRAEIGRTCDAILEDLSGVSGLWHRSVLVNMASRLSLVDRFPVDSRHHRYVQAAHLAPALTQAFQEQPGSDVARAMERVMFAHLDEVVALGRAHGARVLLGANPWEYHVSPSPRVGSGHVGPYPVANRLEKLVRQRYAAEPGVEVLELTEVLRAAEDPSGLFLDRPSNEIHWNARGHLLVGELLARRLVDD